MATAQPAAAPTTRLPAFFLPDKRATSTPVAAPRAQAPAPDFEKNEVRCRSAEPVPDDTSH